MQRRSNIALIALKYVLLCALVLECVSGIVRPVSAYAQEKLSVLTPFSLAVDPGHSGITMAQKNPSEFYVILTNISKNPQAIWRTGSSWAYKNISFEFILPDGQKVLVSEAPQVFTKNNPSTFLVEPGEHRVYSIRLDGWWETHPLLPKADEMPITLKAIYEVPPTPEATRYKVWTGRIESRSYSFTLRQW